MVLKIQSIISLELPLWGKIQKGKGAKFSLNFPLSNDSYNHFVPVGIFPGNLIFSGEVERDRSF